MMIIIITRKNASQCEHIMNIYVSVLLAVVSDTRFSDFSENLVLFSLFLAVQKG